MFLSSQVLKFTFSPYSGLFGSSKFWTYGHINPISFAGLGCQVYGWNLFWMGCLWDVPWITSLSDRLFWIFISKDISRLKPQKFNFLGFAKHLSASGLAVGKLWWASGSTLLSVGSETWFQLSMDQDTGIPVDEMVIRSAIHFCELPYGGVSVVEQLYYNPILASVCWLSWSWLCNVPSTVCIPSIGLSMQPILRSVERTMNSNLTWQSSLSNNKHLDMSKNNVSKCRGLNSDKIFPTKMVKDAQIMAALCRRMLHGCQKFLKECHILLNDDLRLMRKHAVTLKIWVELSWYYVLKNHCFFKRAACFSL